MHDPFFHYNWLACIPSCILGKHCGLKDDSQTGSPCLDAAVLAQGGGGGIIQFLVFSAEKMNVYK